MEAFSTIALAAADAVVAYERAEYRAGVARLDEEIERAGDRLQAAQRWRDSADDEDREAAGAVASALTMVCDGLSAYRQVQEPILGRSYDCAYAARGVWRDRANAGELEGLAIPEDCLGSMADFIDAAAGAAAAQTELENAQIDYNEWTKNNAKIRGLLPKTVFLAIAGPVSEAMEARTAAAKTAIEGTRRSAAYMARTLLVYLSRAVDRLSAAGPGAPLAE